MGKAFYLRLALSNLRRNRRMVMPYFFATAVLSGMFFIIYNLIDSQSVANVIYGPTLQGMLSIGINVMTFFTVIYMLYINSFLMSRRKTEFGLYGVLGLEKRHVGRIIFWENLILSGGGLLLGLVSGAVFGKLVFLILMRAMHSFAPGSTFSPTLSALLSTAGVFLVIFLLTCLYNIFKVRVASPIDLLHGEAKGEKKPRFTVPITILGVLTLGGGYALSLMSAIPTIALLSFWPAVLLVIVGTLCLFTSGSVFILNRLRKNKKFYYQPRNFVAVSGLLHRMKQNAAGLANICILSTMVIITMSGCCSLFFGQEAILRDTDPYDIMLELSTTDPEKRSAAIDEVVETAHGLAEEYGASLEDLTRLTWYDTYLWTTSGEEVSAAFFSADQFNQLAGTQYLLVSDELLLLGGSEGSLQYAQDSFGSAFTLEHLDSVPALSLADGLIKEDTVLIIAADDQALGHALAVLFGDSSDENLARIMHECLYFNIGLSQDDGVAFTAELEERFYDSAQSARTGNSYSTNFRSIFTDRASSLGTYGGLLVLGVFFTILFLTNTVIIIYFKQVSEGMEDRERFTIMQKVGMSDAEVRSTINRQVLIVFFLPLVGALLHTAAAVNIMVRLLELFWLYDIGITLTCMGVISLCFAVVYITVYRFTAKTYYKIVKW
ncbi:MAG TPA: FtsX-like permease family protein [Candidatus Ventrousia excrementavium]|uniref:FtsX-like permease family protein n=1 Tax=Candidatus Ventrousia excrementavium TaxID=2840961 RepID=A0A9D1IUJ5_9CLOT|nr:FtsX-like permease family protein [Candidatus Ventrousia excrementavium]